MDSSSGPPAGWYTDPTQEDTQRYWDGNAWTDQSRTAWTPARIPAPFPEYRAPLYRPKRKRRVLSWVIVAVNILFLVWIIVGASGANSTANRQCAHQADQQRCDSASNAGTAIGVALIIALWVAVDIILGILWLVTRRREPQGLHVRDPRS